MNYDQWKTASPYDDDIDIVEEVDHLLNEPENQWGIPPTTQLEKRLVHLLRELREYVEDIEDKQR